MVAVPKAVLNMIGIEELASMRITNITCLEECLSVYPFIEKEWDGSEMDARTIVGLILRYSITCPIEKNLHSDTADTLGLKCEPVILKAAPLILISQYYIPSKRQRAKEIDHCLKKNLECKYIDKVVLLNEEIYELPVNKKIVQIKVNGRLTFKTVVKWIYDSAPHDALIVIANSDIHLDDTWHNLWSVKMDDIFISLLRWDEQENGVEPVLFGPRADSQDSWVISASSVKRRTWDWSTLDFPFGQGGCDNAFSAEMLRQKFRVVNPCMNLVTHHVHMSNYRTYDPKDVVTKDLYVYVNPTGIHDLYPDIHLSNVPKHSLQVPQMLLSLKGSFTSAQQTTFLKMLSKGRDTPFIDQLPIVQKFQLPIYEFNNVFETYDGLLHSYNSILVGPTVKSAELWSETGLNVVSATVDIKVALVAHCPDEVAKNPVRYLLEYMGKILAMRDSLGDGEWLAMNDPAIMEALQLFSWSTESIPIILRTPNFETWCHKAYAWLPQDGEKAIVTPIEIAALRKAFRRWIPAVKTKRLVCILDDTWVTDTFVEAFEKLVSPVFEVCIIYKSTSISSAAAVLNGAYGVLVFCGNVERWGLFWTLPTGAQVWEIQSELYQSLDLYQLCAASKLDHRLHIVPRTVASAADIEASLNTLSSAFLSESVDDVKEGIPTLFLPHSNTNGFFAHAGDSFREMATIWGERGYVKIEAVQGLTQVWLHSIGDTLLYDRPTLEWLNAAPIAERKWKTALFGNPVPPENGKPWSFWPRRPRHVEQLVSQGVGSEATRERGVVFYGRSENKVQHSKRVGEWQSACDEFIHIIGENPYPFSQKEYLMRLASAKWGLCLAGYGNKCHREIECMAMGCVPIVASNVDMTYYDNPPVEGTHYFRVSGPADIQKVVNVPNEKWQEMSKACRAWWKENASAEGMWHTVKSLS